MKPFWHVVCFLIGVWAAALPANPSPSVCPLSLLRLGSHLDTRAQVLRLRLVSLNAEQVQVELFRQPFGKSRATFTLTSPTAGLWETEIPFETLRRLHFLDAHDQPDHLLYGYRVWGPNWPHHPQWRPGTEIGFLHDVDAHGNRFNPNKLLLDPYAREISHDPQSARFVDDNAYYSGPGTRQLDTATAAPKAVVLPDPPRVPWDQLRRAFKDEVIYEAHLRGLTRGDLSIPEAERGTYRGAIRKIPYLKALGITAIEFLPLHEFQNETNREDTTAGNNYWGYMTHGFFAPERRYATAASQAKAGGVTAEFQEMTEAFHAAGIKVYMDVVYNHTGEGGTDPSGNFSKIFSFRGIDNSTYYQTAGRSYSDNTGCGANFNCAHPIPRKLILDSLKYFRSLGVDGFRFDLASVLGNTQTMGHWFHFDKMAPDNVLNRAIAELPGRAAAGGYGVDLIAEPWAVGPGTYQLGEFPHHARHGAGWAEWNGSFRDVIRRSLNRATVHAPTPGEIAMRVSGSADVFHDDGRKAWHSVNFVTAHDGFTLADLFSYNEKHNNQPAPFGPSDGGENHNLSWDQHLRGDTAEQTARRRLQATRTAMALNLLSLGVPMINAGDEFLRTQKGNNNAYNVDSVGSWLNWEEASAPANSDFTVFTRRLIAFRKAHTVLRPTNFPSGAEVAGRRDLSWYQASGKSAEDRDLPERERGYMQDPTRTYLAWQLTAPGQPAVYLAYNWGFDDRRISLPPPREGYVWRLAGDTSDSLHPFRELGREAELTASRYLHKGRSLVVFVEARLP